MAPKLARTGLAYTVAHEADRVALPRGALVDLVERSGEARVGVRDDSRTPTGPRGGT